MKSPSFFNRSSPHGAMRAESGLGDGAPASFQVSQGAKLEYGTDNAVGHTIGEKILDRAKRLAGIRARGLSDTAQAKLIAIRQSADDALGASQKIGADLDELQQALELAKLNVRIEEDECRRHTDLPADAPQLRRLDQSRADLAELNSESLRLQAARTERVREHQVLRDLAASLFRYVGRLPSNGSVLRFEGRVDAQVPAGDTPAMAVEGRRRRIRELRSDLDMVRVAPYPTKEAKERARAKIHELAEAGRADVSDLVARRGPIVWPIETTRAPIMSAKRNDHGFAVVESPNTVAMFACLFQDHLVQYLDREIDRASDDELALTDSQRAERSTEISAAILLCEREEEALIERMESQGVVMPRRVDADPRAVLGLSSDMPAPPSRLIA